MLGVGCKDISDFDHEGSPRQLSYWKAIYENMSSFEISSKQSFPFLTTKSTWKEKDDYKKDKKQ